MLLSEESSELQQLLSYRGIVGFLCIIHFAQLIFVPSNLVREYNIARKFQVNGMVLIWI